jgi:integrase
MKASRQHYQRGSLLKQRRADGRTEWVLRFRVTLPDGHRVQRQAVVGTTEQYKTESQAQKAADQVRLSINQNAPSATAPTVGIVSRHFKDTELAEQDSKRSWSTKQNYKDMLNLYILPRWEGTRMRDIKAVAVECWLSGINTKKTGLPLADPTRQRIRNVFSVLFTHAQRYELVSGPNPLKFVRQTGKRSRTPDILTPLEVSKLWAGSAPRERALVCLAFGNGLRISEVLGLKWRDIDLGAGTASVTKSVVKGRVGKTKTEVSSKLVPLHADQISDLLGWREVAPYPGDGDWVFASHRTQGLKPYYPDMLMKHHVRRTARSLAITKRIGWHTFRRTYASLLKANGEDVKVVQELLRHSNFSTTMNLYAQAVTGHGRRAQGRVIDNVKRVHPDMLQPARAEASA